jgi:hypothetical protein
MNITPKQRKEFEQRDWAISTAHHLTQESVAQHLAGHGGAGYGATNITYRNQSIPVYLVPFFVVEALDTKKENLSLIYTVYYDDETKDKWVLWRKDEKTTTEKVHHTIKKGYLKTALQMRQRHDLPRGQVRKKNT